MILSDGPWRMLADSGGFHGQRRLAGSVVTTSHAILKKADSRDHSETSLPTRFVVRSRDAMMLGLCLPVRAASTTGYGCRERAMRLYSHDPSLLPVVLHRT
jgi:hypothetical protein